MKRRFPTTTWTFLLAAALLAGDALVEAAEKTPEITFQVQKLNEENAEGPNVERTYFPAGEKKIVFGQPKGTRLTGDGGSLTISLSDLGLDGEIHVDRSPFPVDVDLISQALGYRQAGANSMPAGATSIEPQPPVLNPYPYNGWKSLGFSWNYASGGRSMVRTVNYVNLDIGVQVAVTILATKADAEKVAKVARDFMSSWWMK